MAGQTTGLCLDGNKDESKVRAVQFHLRTGLRARLAPTGEGKLTLADGVFMEQSRLRKRSPQPKFVVVIEEINRGNPAQVFGESLTLLRRQAHPSEALGCATRILTAYAGRSHPREPSCVIGTMNIADRSLALVDLALRAPLCVCWS